MRILAKCCLNGEESWSLRSALKRWKRKRECARARTFIPMPNGVKRTKLKLQQMSKWNTRFLRIVNKINRLPLRLSLSLCLSSSLWFVTRVECFPVVSSYYIHFAIFFQYFCNFFVVIIISIVCHYPKKVLFTLSARQRCVSVCGENIARLEIATRSHVCLWNTLIIGKNMTIKKKCCHGRVQCRRQTIT